MCMGFQAECYESEHEHHVPQLTWRPSQPARDEVTDIIKGQFICRRYCWVLLACRPRCRAPCVVRFADGVEFLSSVCSISTEGPAGCQAPGTDQCREILGCHDLDFAKSHR